MLERATACLKAGAARDSQRCTPTASRSRRMLHSSFWTHGAGALDLPPWAVSTLSRPSDLPRKTGSRTTPGTSGPRQTPPPKMATEGIFLDFLYPPQALAWLQRAHIQRQAHVWVKRNMRRLSDGFVVASRGYSSGYYQPFHRGGDQPVDEESTLHDADVEDGLDEEDWAGQTVPSESNAQSQTPDRAEGDWTDQSFADSPGELAEAAPNLLLSLRSLIMSNRGKAIVEHAEKSQMFVDRAWAMFQSLHDDEAHNDWRLRRELLESFALHRNETAFMHCEELYQSTPTGERTAALYSAMLAVYLRRHDLASASTLHHECLQTLENAYTISKTLVEYALEHDLWELAIQTATQHHRRYTELQQTNQIRLFWLQFSEMPDLLQKGQQIYTHFNGLDGLREADRDTRLFCSSLFKESIFQYLQPAEKNDTQVFMQSKYEQAFLVSICQHVADTDEEPSKFLMESLAALLRSRLQARHYANDHVLASSLYWELRKSSDVKPSEDLLYSLLWRLTWYEPRRANTDGSQTNVTIQDVASDLKFLYGRLSRITYARLLSSTAWSARVELHEYWMEDFRSAYPAYEHWKSSLWTKIYLYARRSDLDKAQQAFAEVKRTATEHGDEPDIKCWNTLLYAHGRADDLDGAFTNFQNLLSMTKLTPDEASFAPIFIMLANRGDVDGVEDFMQQYDEIVKSKRSTTMFALLINAYVNQGETEAAEAILQEAVTKSRSGDVVGNLTPCFNSIMKAYAQSKNATGVMQTYQWMKREEIVLDAYTYLPIISVLMTRRQTEAALRILREEMPARGVQATAEHYASAMQGLVKQRKFQHAMSLYREMLGRNIRPSMAANTLHIKAKTLLEIQKEGVDPKDDSQAMPLEAPIEELAEILERYDGGEVFDTQWSFLDGYNDTTTGDPAPYFETLLQVHGKRRCIEAVQALFERYKEAAKKRGADVSRIPLGIMSKLMSAHWYAGEYNQVEEYWKLAKQRADEIAPPVPVPSFRYLIAERDLRAADPLTLRPDSESYPGLDLDRSDQRTPNSSPEHPQQSLLTDRSASMKVRPAANRRNILNEPLQWYLAALSSESRIIDAITTVSRLLTQGYIMEIQTWNLFICSLLDSKPPLALLAFTLTERFLTPGFRGWDAASARYPARRRNRYDNFQFMQARFVARNVLMPQYRTLVRLGAALLDIRRLEIQGRSPANSGIPPELQKFVGTTREIRKIAAKTVHVVQSMPYAIGDEWQAKYLRREVE